ncbi:GCN5-related N-acetyltransferase [mine drainage metagenome]|uniref:GCN5-related N-acetyltransferase n=1 Tax=mine drainage metagenome TaxID=410659 RepID=T0YN80_9ZZZZ
MARIELRTLEAADIAPIQNWPSYPPEFEDLDYALRVGGWLDEYRNKPATWIYIAEQAREMLAFSILSKTDEADAEFRIALRADRTGQGLGGMITRMTLEKGFVVIGLSRIHLIVRKNNPRAIRLYKHLGFDENGECLKTINGKRVNFLTMDISRESYMAHT